MSINSFFPSFHDSDPLFERNSLFHYTGLTDTIEIVIINLDTRFCTWYMLNKYSLCTYYNEYDFKVLLQFNRVNGSYDRLFSNYLFLEIVTLFLFFKKYLAIVFNPYNYHVLYIFQLKLFCTSLKTNCKQSVFIRQFIYSQ